MATGGILMVSAQIIGIVAFLSIILLFIGAGSLVVTHICVVTRVFLQRRLSGTTGLDGGRQGGLSVEDLGALPCFEWKAEAATAEDCVVCLERFQLGDRCRLLPACRHRFHAHCVDSWLRVVPACPICRTPANRVGGRRLLDGGEERVDGSRYGSEMGLPAVRPVVFGFHSVS